MRTVELYRKSDSAYEEVCLFASNIYQTQLSFTISHFPEYFFAIRDETGILGCIGLNSTLNSALFVNDERVLRALEESGVGTHFCEQSIFALEHYSPGVPILIATVTEYANSMGIEKLVYAGTVAFRKIIEHLGFCITECGPVDLSVLHAADRKKYELWNATQHPVTCILDTKDAPRIAFSTFNKHSHRVMRGKTLTTSLLANYRKLHQREAA